MQPAYSEAGPGQQPGARRRGSPVQVGFIVKTALVVATALLIVTAVGPRVAQADLYTQDLSGSRLWLELRRGGAGGGAYRPAFPQPVAPFTVTGELRLRHHQGGSLTLDGPTEAIVRYGRVRYARLEVLSARLTPEAGGGLSGYLEARLVPTRYGRWLPGAGEVQRLVVGGGVVRSGSVVFGPDGGLETELLAVGPRLRLGRPEVSARWVLDWRGSGDMVAIPSPTAGVLGLLGLVLAGRVSRSGS